MLQQPGPFSCANHAHLIDCNRLCWFYDTAVFAHAASVLTLAAGYLFGPIYGTAIVSAAATLGATMAFFVSRYVARPLVVDRLGSNARFQQVSANVDRKGALASAPAASHSRDSPSRVAVECARSEQPQATGPMASTDAAGMPLCRWCCYYAFRHSCRMAF
jgi:hypothetical protein